MAAFSLVAESDLADLRREGIACAAWLQKGSTAAGVGATQAAVETAPMDRQCRPIRRVLWLRRRRPNPKRGAATALRGGAPPRRLARPCRDDGPEFSA